jgi:hypothetical protein
LAIAILKINSKNAMSSNKPVIIILNKTSELNNAYFEFSFEIRIPAEYLLFCSCGFVMGKARNILQLNAFLTHSPKWRVMGLMGACLRIQTSLGRINPSSGDS